MTTNPRAAVRMLLALLAAAVVGLGVLAECRGEALAMPDPPRPPQRYDAPGESAHSFCYNLGAATAGNSPAPRPHLLGGETVASVAHQPPLVGGFKQCIKCSLVLPLDHFYPSPRRRDGLDSSCRSCQLARSAAYYAANKERKLQACAEYYAANKEKHRALCKAWAQANSERLAEYYASYAANNSDRIKQYGAEWYRQNRQRRAELSRAWALANPDRIRAIASRRRARASGASGNATAEQIAARWDYYGGRCWMCGDNATCTDHVIPLANGGTHWPANLRPACTSCNCRKRDRDYREFAAVVATS